MDLPVLMQVSYETWKPKSRNWRDWSPTKLAFIPFNQIFAAQIPENLFPKKEFSPQFKNLRKVFIKWYPAAQKVDSDHWDELNWYKFSLHDKLEEDIGAINQESKDIQAVHGLGLQCLKRKWGCGRTGWFWTEASAVDCCNGELEAGFPKYCACHGAHKWCSFGDCEYCNDLFP